jgi:DNA-binding NarL/FixJ family response regulator
MTNFRILVADDHEVVRRGVRALLESQPGWQVVGEAVNGREALERAKLLKPDLVILDISMPDLNGIEATRAILKLVPEAEILVLTMHDSEELVRRVLEAGARGYVVKTDVGRRLIEAADAMRRHEAFFTPSAAMTVLDGYLKRSVRSGPKPLLHELTPREREVLQLLAEGKANKEVASLLGISIYTVETHRSNIMHKLNLHSVSELTRYAIRNHLLSA